MLLLRAPDGTGVDLSMGLLPFEWELVERASVEEVTASVQMPVATAEDLAAMKLVAARSRDVDDARRLLELHPSIDRERVRRIVTEYAEALGQPELVQGMERIFGPE